jgi:hypothetical protein
MYMAPVTATLAATGREPSHPVLRRVVGVPVLALAGVVALPWLAAQTLVAGLVLAGRATLQAVDYAGTVALGR